MLKIVTIEELVPGMYVTGVKEQSGQVKIRTQGLVKNKAIVAALKKKGILKVEVDLDKSQLSELAVEETSAPEPAPAAPKQPRKSFDQEVSHATQLYDEAKDLQRRALDAVEKGMPFEIADHKRITRCFVESLERNPSALLCITSIRKKDDYLLEHSLNVAILMATFARYLELPTEMVNELAFAGLIHDIGKVNVPGEILNKTSRLTDEEMVEMRHHVIYGMQAVDKVADVPAHVRDVVAQHHERIDGKGYPEQLSGDQISRYGRMIAIVDSFDAMVAERCYKKGMPPIKALQRLMKDAQNGGYDDELVQKFVKCIGVHPVGSLVKLSNAKLAMVMEMNPHAPLKPRVKVFYSITNHMYIDPKNLDLASPNCEIKIETAIKPEEFKLNFLKFFKQAIAV